MIIISSKVFMKKNLKNGTRNESEVHRVYNYPISSRDSKIYSDNGFLNIGNGNMGGTHWCCFKKR